MPIRPGDATAGKVTTDGKGTFTLTIRDTTTGRSFTTTQTLKRARLASVEVIAEAPGSSGGVLPWPTSVRSASALWSAAVPGRGWAIATAA
jgi:hypothetical protein